jgi:hypothetical protein
MKKSKRGGNDAPAPKPQDGTAAMVRDAALSVLQSHDPLAQRERIKADVKRRLLDRANEFVKEGKYPFALSEIKRIYVIDPSDNEARQYEGVIQRLIAEDRPVLHLLSPLRVGAGGVVPEETEPPVVAEPAAGPEQPRKFSLRERLLKTKRSWRLIPPSDPAEGI